VKQSNQRVASALKHLQMAVLLGVISYQATVYAQSAFRQRETNPNYQQGDWVSYSMARFITSIAIGEQYVHFGTLNSGIIRLDQFSNEWDYPWTTSNGLADNEVWTVAYDRDTGFIWCATKTAVSYYQPAGRRWTNQFKDEFGMPYSDEIESIAVCPDKIRFFTRGGRTYESGKFGGVILVAGRRGFDAGYQDCRWFGRKAPQPTALPHFFMSDGFLFDLSGYVEDRNFYRARISAVQEDQWGNVWLGTWGLGAGKGDLRSMQLKMLPFGLAHPSVKAMAIARDRLWTGGAPDLERSGITAWDFASGAWYYYEQRNISDLRSDLVNAITVDGEDIWLGTTYGLTRYAIGPELWKNYTSFDGLSDNMILAVEVDSFSVWIGTRNGINRISKTSLAKTNRDSLEVEELVPGDLRVVKVYDLEMMENLLWAATDRGIYVYDTFKKESGFSDEVEGPMSSVINSISRYDDELWFASRSGIDVYDVGKREWLGVPEGRYFPATYVYRVLAGRDAVWAASDEGVLKFDRRSRTWRTFTMHDGLLDNHVNTILLDGDHIWFGSESGITQFFWNDPSRID
jgi:ligand-binding sensor domain-containing protein